MKTREECEINYKGQHYCLNPRLLAKQKAEDNLDLIKELHYKMIDLLESAKSVTSWIGRRAIVKKVEKLEYEMQIAWKFTPNSDFHRYWNKIEGCTCSRLDNEDSYGTKYRTINQNCIFHGDPNYKSKTNGRTRKN